MTAFRGWMFDGNLQRPMRAGDSIQQPAPLAIAADANDTLTVDKIARRFVQYTGFSAGRNLTTDTAANIIAAFPEMDIGDTITLIVSCVAAFAGTYVAGANVTLAGRAT